MTTHLLPELKRARLILDQADWAFEQASYLAAETDYQEALKLIEPLKKLDKALMGRCLLGLGRACNALGRFADARRWVESAAPLLAGDPALKATAAYALGEIISNQGQQDEAAVHFVNAYQLRRRKSGKNHPDTLDCLSMLAVISLVRGKKEAALIQIGEAVAAARLYAGAPAAAIGRVYQRQGGILMRDPQAYEQAQAAFRQALAIFQASGRADHPDAGLALNNLAYLLASHELWGEARDLLLRSLAIHQNAFGCQSPFNLSVLGNLSDVEKHLDNLEAAHGYAARALVTAVRSMGVRSPQALAALRRMVTVMGARGQAGDEKTMLIAMPFYTCLAALEAAAGKGGPQKPAHPEPLLPPEQAAERLERLVNRLETDMIRPPRSTEEQAAEQRALAEIQEHIAMGDDAMKAGDAASAYAIYAGALKDQEALFGAHHLDHLPLLSKLARASEAAGHPSAVLPLHERALAIHAAVLGEDHPHTMMAMLHVYDRLVYEYGREDARTVSFWRQLYGLMERTLGADHPNTRLLLGQQVRAKPAAQPVQAHETQPALARSERLEAAMLNFADPAGVLEGLEAVNWHAITHAYGPADDIPRLLKWMLSPDALVRETAWDELINDVWHQGSLYEATVAVTPFLLHYLDDPAYPDRSWVMFTLAGWAEASFCQTVVSLPGSLLADGAGMQAPQAAGDEMARKNLKLKEQLNRAVARGLPKFKALLDDPERDMQRLALFILSQLHDCAAQCVPAVTAWLAAAADAGLRVEALKALRNLMDDSPEAIAFFTQWTLAPDEPLSVLFQAAAGVIERAREATPEPVVEVLLAAWPTVRQGMDEASQEDDSLYGIIDPSRATDLAVLNNLGGERARAARQRATVTP